MKGKGDFSPHTISIPYGTIKTKNVKTSLDRENLFQFHTVIKLLPEDRITDEKGKEITLLGKKNMYISQKIYHE